MTHCDKKPRGKVGGSAISVYQALLHPPTESLGTRLGAVRTVEHKLYTYLSLYTYLQNSVDMETCGRPV